MALKGIKVSGPAQMKEALRTLLLTYNLIVQEYGSKLYFKEADFLDEISVLEADLAAHSAGQNAARKISITDVSGLSLPQEVEIEFIEPDNDYQTGSQKERRIDAPADHVLNIRLPLSLDSQEAREIALRELWKLWANRQRISTSLPPSYLHILEGDLLSIPVNGELYKIRIIKVDRGVNGILQIEGDVEETETYSYTAPNNPPIIAPVPIYYPESLLFHVMDLPPLSDKHTMTFGLYSMACLWNPGATWHGGSFYYSRDDTTYYFLSPISSEAVVGRAATVLGSVSGFTWDRVSTVDVEIFEGTLSSATELEVLNGTNWAIVGNEIIAFKTATLLGTRKYRLSILLRGKRNTEASISGHAIGDPFILLYGETLEFIPFNLNFLGTKIYYKAATPGTTLTDVDSKDVTPAGNSIMPFTPGTIKGARDASDNLTITWVRRTRALTRLFVPALTPLLEPFEKYEIDIYDGATVVRTIEVDDATTVIYTAAQQTTDGLTPGDPVVLKMYQMSALMGRGREASATI